MLNLIVATQAEAEPVISALKLKKVPAALTYYRNRHLHLLVSGIGKSRASMACGWLAGQSANGSSHSTRSTTAWLNFGIAGHPTAPLESLMVAHKVTDLASNSVFYPHRIFKAPALSELASSDLVTVDKPLDNYLPDNLHDMEASAFVDAARSFSHAELVQSLKVVSDNEEQPFTKITAKLATTLIKKNIEQILVCVDELHALAQCTAIDHTNITETILGQWHFSVSQTVQLERLLQRYQVIYEPLTDIPEPLQNMKSSKEVLAWLQNSADSIDSYL